jgi:hypothetical protein
MDHDFENPLVLLLNPAWHFLFSHRRLLVPARFSHLPGRAFEIQTA